MTDIANCDLASIYPKPSERVLAKARPSLDVHSKKFIEMSPFCVLATSGADGSVDASPRGGTPGFVHIVGDNSLLMPDRSGNNRIDSYRNIVEGSGFLQMIFFVPGIDETLRVGGRGVVDDDRLPGPAWQGVYSSYYDGDPNFMPYYIATYLGLPAPSPTPRTVTLAVCPMSVRKGKATPASTELRA